MQTVSADLKVKNILTFPLSAAKPINTKIQSEQYAVPAKSPLNVFPNSTNQ